MNRTSLARSKVLESSPTFKNFASANLLEDSSAIAEDIIDFVVVGSIEVLDAPGLEG